MARETVVVQREIEVVDALSALCGLTKELLFEAMMAGEIARNGSTPNDPIAAAGFFAHVLTLRTLRERLIPMGWTRRERDDFSAVVSPDGTVRIVVCTGNEFTGLQVSEDTLFKSKNPKGPATIAAVNNNDLQLSLFPDLAIDPSVLASSSACSTWWLMRRRDGDTLYAELSLPRAVGADGRVDSWERRIVLGSFQIDSGRGSDGNDRGDAIVIDVPRK